MLQDGNNLCRCFGPGHRSSIHLFERMNNIFIMQRYIRLTKRRTQASLKCSIPLFILVTKTHDNQITIFKQCFCTYPVHFRRFMVAPVIITLRTQHITRCITRFVISYRRCKNNRQVISCCTLHNLLAPVGMYFAG